MKLKFRMILCFGFILFSSICSHSLAQSAPHFDALNALDFISAQKGWAVGRNSIIIHTQDGGESWQEQYRGSSIRERALLDVVFFDSSNGIAVGMEGLILTTQNGGRYWNANSAFPSPYYETLIEQQEKLEQLYQDATSVSCSEKKEKDTETKTETETSLIPKPESFESVEPNEITEEICHQDFFHEMEFQLNKIRTAIENTSESEIVASL
jgi:hypothetical protein